MIQLCSKSASSCDLMKKDVLRGQCWPGLICDAICFLFSYSMFFPFPLSIQKKVLACWNSHHTALPIQRASFTATTHSSFTFCFRSFFPFFYVEIASCSLYIRTQNCNLFCHFNLDWDYFFAATVGNHSLSNLFFCTSSHTPSHSFGCGVNFHYTTFRYNDFKWASLLTFVAVVFPLWYAFYWLLIL